MSRLLRSLILLLLAGTFLAASFVGGMVHSVVSEFAVGVPDGWWAAAAGVVLVVAAWQWRRRSRRAPPAASPPPQT